MGKAMIINLTLDISPEDMERLQKARAGLGVEAAELFKMAARNFLSEASQRDRAARATPSKSGDTSTPGDYSAFVCDRV